MIEVSIWKKNGFHPIFDYTINKSLAIVVLSLSLRNSSREDYGVQNVFNKFGKTYLWRHYKILIPNMVFFMKALIIANNGRVPDGNKKNNSGS